MEQTQGVMEQVQMVHVDVLHPHEQNPRIDAAQVEDLTESIREHGVEVPLVAAPRDDSWTDFVVLGGHRRLTAAHALGLAEVPVQIRGDLTDPKAQLAFMATENILRDQLTAVEEARLVQDMLDLGMTQAEVAKQTALGKKRVSERVKLSKLAGDTGEKVHRGQITVDDALVIAEYSDDPEAVEQLEESAGTYNFDWAVSRAKQRRETAQALADARKKAKKLGIRLAAEDADFVSLAELVHEGWTTPAIKAAAADFEDDAWTKLIIAEHEDCPGHSARLIASGEYRGDLEAGCDQVATQHADTTHTKEPAAEPEPKHDPWDDITAEDLDAARIHREQHLANVLPDLDVTAEIKADTIKGIIGFVWHGYGEPSPNSLAFIQGITEVEGKDKVARILDSWDLPALLWLKTHWWDLMRAHYSMTIGRQGSSYWGSKSKLRTALERTDYRWSPVEQQAILLATGIPHDADPADGTDGAEALAEGGEAA